MAPQARDFSGRKNTSFWSNLINTLKVVWDFIGTLKNACWNYIGFTEINSTVSWDSISFTENIVVILAGFYV